MSDSSNWKELIELAAQLNESPSQELPADLFVALDTAEQLFGGDLPEDDLQAYALSRFIRALRHSISRCISEQRLGLR